MTTATLAQTLDTLRATACIREVDLSNDGQRQRVAIAYVFAFNDPANPQGDYTADSYEAWAAAERMLRQHGFRHCDSAGDGCDFEDLWVRELTA